MIWGMTELPGFFYSREFNYYQKTYRRMVAYISKQYGDKWQYKLQLYARGPFLRVCDIEYRSSDINLLMDLANEWMEEYKDGDKERLAYHRYNPFNPYGYWQRRYKREGEWIDMGGRMLSEQNTPDMDATVTALAVQEFPEAEGIRVFFEHGHWWVNVYNPNSIAVYDVVDANTESGIAFELVHEKEEF